MTALAEARCGGAELRLTPPALRRHGTAVNAGRPSSQRGGPAGRRTIDLARLAKVWPELDRARDCSSSKSMRAMRLSRSPGAGHRRLSPRRSAALPADLDYAAVGSLSREVCDKLARARPTTLGAAVADLRGNAGRSWRAQNESSAVAGPSPTRLREPGPSLSRIRERVSSDTGEGRAAWASRWIPGSRRSFLFHVKHSPDSKLMPRC